MSKKIPEHKLRDSRSELFQDASKKMSERITLMLSLIVLLLAIIQSDIFPDRYNYLVFMYFIPIFLYIIYRYVFWRRFYDIAIWITLE
jgi:hypothetical protein